VCNSGTPKTFACTLPHSSAINNSPRAGVWLAGVFVASLGIVRHLRFQENKQRAIKFSIVPATGLYSQHGFVEAAPKGTFKARTSKQAFFSQFLSSVIGLRENARRSRRFSRTEDHTVARVLERQRIKSPPNLKFNSDREGHEFTRAAKLRLGSGL